MASSHAHVDGDEFSIAIRAFSLGILFGCGVVIYMLCSSIWMWGAYIAFLGWFHCTEYMLTALYNRSVLSLDSFLLNHSREYQLAALASMVEFWLEWLLFPNIKGGWTVTWIISISGFIIALCGQAMRNLAMYHCKSNFKHLIVEVKEKDHMLVTDGIYSVSRHPSYCGWFWWSVGTQMLLCNPFCLIAYAMASWRFFNDRIPYEESLLINFFGDDYKQFKKRVPTLIPFIP